MTFRLLPHAPSSLCPPQLRHAIAAWLSHALLGLVLLAASLGLARAQPAPSPEAPARGAEPLLMMSEAGQWWLDTEGRLDAARVAALPEPAWRPLASLREAGLRSGQALWIRFTVPQTEEAGRRYLEVPYSSVDRVALYARDSLGHWVLRQVAGDTIAVSRWPVPHRYPLLPIATSADAATPYLMRVQNMHGFSAPLRFAAEGQINRTDQQVALILGAFFGLAALAFLQSAVGAVSLRDSTYALYAVSVLFMALTQASMTGMAGLHLWPDSPVWNDRAPFTLATLAVGAMMLVLSRLVSTHERSPGLYRVVLGLFAVSLAAGATMALGAPAWRGVATALCVSTCSVYTAGLMFWAWYRGDRWAPWVALGTLPVAAGAAFPLLRLMGWASGTAWTQFMMQFGIAIELPVLLVVLMLRNQPQRETVRRLQGKAHTDPSTGLATEEVFLARALRMAARSERTREASAILVIDVANTAELQRHFGRRSTLDLPLRVAARILSIARDIDTVARLGEHRFGLLLDGPLSPADIEATGPRIVARCLMPHQRKPAEWVTRVRIAYIVLPHQHMNAARAIEYLQEFLDRVPEDARKAIFAVDGVRAGA